MKLSGAGELPDHRLYSGALSSEQHQTLKPQTSAASNLRIPNQQPGGGVTAHSNVPSSQRGTEMINSSEAIS